MAVAGVFLIALLTGAVSRAIAELGEANHARRTKFRSVQSYLRSNTVEPSLQKQIIDYYEYVS